MSAFEVVGTSEPSGVAAGVNRPRKRLGKREKQKLRIVNEGSKEIPPVEPVTVIGLEQQEWSWIHLADETSYNCPVVFSSDSS